MTWQVVNLQEKGANHPLNLSGLVRVTTLFAFYNFDTYPLKFSRVVC